MAEATLVENQIEDGQRLVEELSRAGFDVRAACWVKACDDDRWYLYIASKAVDDKGPTAAYCEVHLAMRHLPASKIGPFDVKVIGATHSILGVLELQRRFPTQIPVWFHGLRLGDVAIDEAYIYAPVQP
ncbi:MAG TPA: hypothetical protein VGX78_10050 [Pirellulales bacterium]|jgi:hypothetical protein|nr:hypothetical protein [Pirellulales bacterium]